MTLIEKAHFAMDHNCLHNASGATKAQIEQAYSEAVALARLELWSEGVDRMVKLSVGVHIHEMTAAIQAWVSNSEAAVYGSGVAAIEYAGLIVGFHMTDPMMEKVNA